jgi:hypothetical protein
MRLEKAKAQGFTEMNHSIAMVNRDKLVKRLVMKLFQYAIDFLMHIAG